MKGVSRRQARQIEEHMRNIKKARDSDYWGEEEVIRRTNALYRYLDEEGIVPGQEEFLDE